MAVLTTKSQPRFSVAGDAFGKRRWPLLIKSAFGAVVAGCVLAAGQAQAIVVNVGGQDYDVTTFTGSYNDNASKFNTPDNGGSMPWWGDLGLASSFASVIWDSLGMPNPEVYGPFFVYTLGPDEHLLGAGYIYMPWICQQTGAQCNPTEQNAGVYRLSIWQGASYVWAQATSVPAAGSPNVPGPLPILGLAAAFGFSRKLRKRIKLHRGTSAVPTSPAA